MRTSSHKEEASTYCLMIICKLTFLIFFSRPLNAAGSILSFLFSGNGTSETATSLIKSLELKRNNSINMLDLPVFQLPSTYRLISISRLESEVGVDLASAFRFLAMVDPAPPEYELPVEMLPLLATLPAPVSITEVGPGAEEPVVVFGILAVDTTAAFSTPPELLLLLVVVLVVVLPNTESELTTMVSVKLDVVNLAMASFDRRSLLLPV